MALMSAELYDALLDAGASEDKARKAAEAAAGYDTRFAALDTRLVQIDGRLVVLDGRMTALEGRLTMLTWMLSINLTLTLFGFSAMLGLLWKLLKP